jgi:hypothetical protein
MDARPRRQSSLTCVLIDDRTQKQPRASRRADRLLVGFWSGVRRTPLLGHLSTTKQCKASSCRHRDGSERAPPPLYRTSAAALPLSARVLDVCVTDALGVGGPQRRGYEGTCIAIRGIVCKSRLHGNHNVKCEFRYNGTYTRVRAYVCG